MWFPRRHGHDFADQRPVFWGFCAQVIQSLWHVCEDVGAVPTQLTGGYRLACDDVYEMDPCVDERLPVLVGGISRQGAGPGCMPALSIPQMERGCNFQNTFRTLWF